MKGWTGKLSMQRKNGVCVVNAVEQRVRATVGNRWADIAACICVGHIGVCKGFLPYLSPGLKRYKDGGQEAYC